MVGLETKGTRPLKALSVASIQFPVMDDIARQVHDPDQNGSGNIFNISITEKFRGR